MKRFDSETKGEQISETVDVSVSSSQQASTGLSADPDSVTVHWGDILPWLVDAIVSKRSWVHDFDADKVVISSDFHNVICAYRHYRGNLDRPDSDCQVDKAA